MSHVFTNPFMSKITGRTCKIIRDYGLAAQKCSVLLDGETDTMIAYYGELTDIETGKTMLELALYSQKASEKINIKLKVIELSEEQMSSLPFPETARAIGGLLVLEENPLENHLNVEEFRKQWNDHILSDKKGAK